MSIFCRSEWRLTGRARARPGWFGKQVLQIEVETLSFSATPAPPGRDRTEWEQRMRAQGRTRRTWKDATWEDTSFLVACGSLEPRLIEPLEPWPRA